MVYYSHSGYYVLTGKRLLIDLPASPWYIDKGMRQKKREGLSFVIAIISLSILSIPVLTGTALSDIYRYVDERGVIHFTNTPKGKEYKRIMTEGTEGQHEIKGPHNVRDRSYYEGIILRKSRKYNLDPSLVRAIITVESNWQPYAVSKKGAMGLMQLMPATARKTGVRNPFDPEQNIEGGTRYLRTLLDMFNNDLRLALAAYNAGPETVRKFGGVPPIAETRRYIRKVLSMYNGNIIIRGNSSIYKVILEDGSVLFTNTPAFYKKYNPSRF
jgi:soluble lytic murein transglycosylase